NRFSFEGSIPEVPMMRSASWIAEVMSGTTVADSKMSAPCMALCRASGHKAHGFTSTRSCTSKFFMARATAPTLPSFFGSTKTTRTPGTSGRYIQREIFLGMRVALKIAYDGRAFFGSHHQPARRTEDGASLRGVTARALRRASSLFIGEHDFGAFTPDPAEAPLTIDGIEVKRSPHAILFDVRARTFRRNMVRRIVAAAIRCARGELSEVEIRRALSGIRRDFGMVRPEPLFLMDVRYPFDLDVIVKPRVRDAWRLMEQDTDLRRRLIAQWHRATHGIQ